MGHTYNISPNSNILQNLPVIRLNYSPTKNNKTCTYRTEGGLT